MRKHLNFRKCLLCLHSSAGRVSCVFCRINFSVFTDSRELESSAVPSAGMFKRATRSWLCAFPVGDSRRFLVRCDSTARLHEFVPMLTYLPMQSVVPFICQSRLAPSSSWAVQECSRRNARMLSSVCVKKKRKRSCFGQSQMTNRSARQIAGIRCPAQVLILCKVNLELKRFEIRMTKVKLRRFRCFKQLVISSIVV